MENNKKANAEKKVKKSDKKTYVTVPVLLRVKSGRALKYAKILIDQCAEQHGLKENPKFVEIDAIAAVEAFMAE